MGQDQSTPAPDSERRVQAIEGSGSALAAAAAAVAAEDASLLRASRSTIVPAPQPHATPPPRAALAGALGALAGASSAPIASIDADSLQAVLAHADGGARARAVVVAQGALAEHALKARTRARTLRAAVDEARVQEIAVSRLADTLDRLAMDAADVCHALRIAVENIDDIAGKVGGEGELASFADYLQAHPPVVRKRPRRPHPVRA